MSVASWPKVRIRFVSELNPSKSEIEHLSRDTEVTFLPMDAIGDDGSIRLDSTQTLAVVDQGYTYFRNGDVTIAKITPCFENGKGALMSGLLGGIGFGTTELIVVRPNHSRITGSFLNWLFISPHFRKTAEAAMYGAGGQKRVPDNFVRDFAILLPTLVEQTAIVAFLDRETYKIDALVAEQERLIALLKEKRQAVISHAVTKGLNPNAPMKNSGVRWLGDVPAHWRIAPVKHLTSHVIDCLHTTPTYEGDRRFPAIRTADVERGKLDLSSARLVSLEVYNERVQRLRPEGGDVLYTREGERFGLAALVPPGIDLCLGQRMMMFRVNDRCNSDYLMWTLNSNAIYEQVLSGITGATAPHVNIADVVNFQVPQPPKDEQQRITNYIENSVQRVDILIDEATKATTLLGERRAALISAAVTGKIDVRDTVRVLEAA